VRIVYDIDIIINIYKGSTDAVRELPLIGFAAAVGMCKGATGAQKSIEWLPSFVQPVLNILSCHPDPDTTGAYGTWQKWVLDAYNHGSGRYFLNQPATSLYENMYASLAGLCLPGIIYNLEKYRQVRCREIICLQNEVPAGIATVESCSKLGEYLTCRFFLGPVAKLSPLNIVDITVNWLKSVMSSPVGLIKLALQVPCLFSCDTSSTLSALCTWSAIIVKVGDMVNTVAGAIISRPSITGDPYCGQIK
jgi:hypothetical protein